MKKYLLTFFIVAIIAGLVIFFQINKEKHQAIYREAYVGLASPNPDFAKIKIQLEEYLEYNSKDATAYHRLGLTLRNLNDLDGAIEAYSKALNLDSTLVSTYNNLGVLYTLNNNNSKASKAYLKAIYLDSTNINVRYNLGLSLQKLGKYQESFSHLKKAIELYPEHFKAVFTMGLTLSYLGKLNQAIIHFDKAIFINPDFSDAYLNRGIIHDLKGNSAFAIEDFKKAIKLAPQNELGYHNFALLQLKKGRDYDARTILKEGLLKMPEDKGAILHADFAEIHIMREKYELALVELEKALKLSPNYFIVLLKTGYANLQLKQYRKASEAYRKAKKFAPKNREILENLYRIYRSLGYKEKADVYLKELNALPAQKDKHLSVYETPEKSDYHR